MAATGDTTPANTAAKGGDHDRVAMLSVRADGSPDQHDPEFIGDPEAAKAATAEQFRQQAVSAADVRVRGVESGTAETSTTEDPTIVELQKAHAAAAKGAEKAAEATVTRLHEAPAAK